MRAFHWDGEMPPPSSSGLHATRHVRHMLSRRAFVGAAAGVAGAGLLWPIGAAAAPKGSLEPKPTANVVTLNGVGFHFTFFGPGIDPSPIDDFNGFVGVADVQGTGTATNPDGSTETLLFDTDMRFASGVYVGTDGAVHNGTFMFV
jgi:hypothetical protein